MRRCHGPLYRSTAISARDRCDWPRSGCSVPHTTGNLEAVRMRKPSSGPADDEPLLVTGAIGVCTAGGAGNRRGARHRAHLGGPALVQATRAGHLDRPAPHAVPLAHHEPLAMTRAAGVATAGCTTARRAA